MKLILLLTLIHLAHVLQCNFCCDLRLNFNLLVICPFHYDEFDVCCVFVVCVIMLH